MSSHVTPEYSKKYYGTNKGKIKEYQKKYNKKNKEKVAKRHKDYVEKNKEAVKQRQKEWYEVNKKRILADRKQYRIDNIGKINEYLKENRDTINIRMHKYRQTPEVLARHQSSKYRMNGNITTNMRKSLKGTKQRRRWEDLVGYTIDDLMKYIESLFRDNMSWDNYGKGGWHLDHIIPIDLWKFNTYKDNEFKQCWALCNLQPLWEKDNCSKQNRMEGYNGFV